jgi:5-methylthioribose kinase
MTYKALDTKSVIDYIKSRPALGSILPPDASISAKEVGDGNLNLVFILQDDNDSKHSAVLKQALPYLRVAGESWPLTRERMHFETQALLLQNKLAPGLVPEIYDYDEEMSLVIMEYLGQHEVMRKPLVRRERFPKFADHISSFMARTLFFTSDLYLTGVEKKKLQANYINPYLSKIQEDFVFTNPFMESPENHWDPEIDDAVQAVRKNSQLKLGIAEMKESYMTHAQCLLHSDLHTGSIMLNQNDTRVIDPEFAFYGPMGFDVGALLENLVLNYLSHYAHTPDLHERAEYQEYLLDMLRKVWNEFARKFEDLWVENPLGELMPARYWDYPGGVEAFAEFRRHYIQDILRDSSGHGGCKMLRRMMGIVNVWDITSIQDIQKRAVCEQLAIKIGSRWILERNQMTSIEDLIDVVLDETKEVNRAMA